MDPEEAGFRLDNPNRARYLGAYDAADRWPGDAHGAVGVPVLLRGNVLRLRLCHPAEERRPLEVRGIVDA